jgi:hypothetical protein
MAQQAAEREQRFKEQQEHERTADEQRGDALRRATGGRCEQSRPSRNN